MTPERRSIMSRVAKWGYHVVCAGCALEQRHKPERGRLREARCRACGATALRKRSWVLENPGRWAQLVSERQAVRLPFIAR